MKICWEPIVSLRAPVDKKLFFPFKWNSFALEIYYYFKNNIVQSKIWLGSVFNIEKEEKFPSILKETSKKTVNNKKNKNINNTIIIHL